MMFAHLVGVAGIILTERFGSNFREEQCPLRPLSTRPVNVRKLLPFGRNKQLQANTLAIVSLNRPKEWRLNRPPGPSHH